MGAPAKKYSWKRGESIEGTFLTYVCEAGYRDKHRCIMAKCDLCDNITLIRVDHITSGKKKSCGCHHKQLIESGKLRHYSLVVRNGKPWLQRGGWHWKDGVALSFRRDILSNFDVEELAMQIALFLKEYVNGMD